MIVAGIDVGKKGAIAFVGMPEPRVFPQPLIGNVLDDKKMADLIMRFMFNDGIGHCFIELVQAMPDKFRKRRQGSASIMSYGKHFGTWWGILVGLDISRTIVSPNKWKRAMGVTSDKQTSIVMGQRLFPKVSLLPTDKCRVPSDGMAEALLIAEYGRRVLAGK